MNLTKPDYHLKINRKMKTTTIIFLLYYFVDFFKYNQNTEQTMGKHAIKGKISIVKKETSKNGESNIHIKKEWQIFFMCFEKLPFNCLTFF